MDTILALKAAAIAVVEGLTEFIPVSSTGHMILVDDLLLGFKKMIGEDPAECFTVVIQLPAILAIVVLYWRRFLGLFNLLAVRADVSGPIWRRLTLNRTTQGFAGWRGMALLFLTTLPALVLGVLLASKIKEHLFNAGTVAIGLAVGAIAILILEKRKFQIKAATLDELTYKQALAIGCFQCLAMWPGMSRSASTILGGLICKLNRQTAAEYSFLAAVPVMFAVTVHDVYEYRHIFSADMIGIFILGSIISFVTALLAVKWFVRLLQKWTLEPFAWYRLYVAGVVGIVYYLKLV
jgi:undecaprenyl-diphosphatase